MSFAKVLNILDQIAEMSSTNGKVEIIAQYAEMPLFQRVCMYALNPYLMFNMSGTIKNKKLKAVPMDPAVDYVFPLLDQMAAARGLSKEEKEHFSATVQMYGIEAVEVVNRILNKDLRCGAAYKLFVKASSEFASIPYHHPMKGGDDWDKFYRQAGGRSNICWSYKLDGTRTWAIVDLRSKSVRYLSFNGHELPNFAVLDEDMLTAAYHVKPYHTALTDKVIFDGECTYVGGDFTKHMSNFRRLKNADPSGFRFRAFDIPNCPGIFSTRYHVLQGSGLLPWHPMAAVVPTDFPETPTALDYFSLDQDGLESLAKVTYLPHFTLTSSPKALTNYAVAMGLEGLMLKTWDHVYENKRSGLWCKYKVFHTEDLPVVGRVRGTGKYSETLGALIVERDGVQIEVGSGYTDADRDEFWVETPKVIEVKYQEVTHTGSLRFPIFLRRRDDKD